MTFSDELILGVTLGILITGLAIYLFLKIEPHHPIKKLIKRVYKWMEGYNREPPPASKVKAGEMHFGKNLDKSTVHLDLKLVLEMLSEYQATGTPEILAQLHEELKKHTPEGNNALHEYISHEHAEVETAREMLEIEPELLTEENAHGETALHTAVEHGHEGMAEMLAEPTHFHTHEAYHAFLHHADHQGHTALHGGHDIRDVHLWHYHPPHQAHDAMHEAAAVSSGKMRGEGPREEHWEADTWKGEEGHGRKLVEKLLHEGILVEHNGHLEVSDVARENIRQHARENETRRREEANRAGPTTELLVNQYSPLHHSTPSQSQERPRSENRQENPSSGGVRRTNRPYPE